MGREHLTKAEQDELDYISLWWEQKEKQSQKKLERRQRRMKHLENVCELLGAAVAEVVLIFRDK